MLATKEKDAMSEEQAPRYIALDDASAELGVNRTTLYYYMRLFQITPEKFPLDRRKYITVADFERIKAAKQAAMEKRHY